MERDQDPRVVVAAVRAAQAGGSLEARELLVRRAARLALRTASALTSRREQADEVSQHVAIEVLRSIGKLKDPEAFDAWVHRITVRRVWRVLRKAAALRKHELPLALRPEVSSSPATASHADLVALRCALGVAMADLSKRQRLALALRYIHDLSDDEIAEALGCRVGTVHSLLSRARSSLRASSELAAFAPTKEVNDAAVL